LYIVSLHTNSTWWRVAKHQPDEESCM